jgi:N-acetyl-S-(2-succino)cysteine monooxygenase
MTPRQMHLNLFMAPGGYHEGSWRVPDSQAEQLFTFPYVARIARQAERAKIDAVFLADLLSNFGNPNWFRTPRAGSGMYEAITTMAALAAVTSRIGLIASASTSFSEPYNIARQFATIDNLSGGRAGWNIVTSYGGEENFSQPLLEHDERYRRAAEFVEVVTGLWDTWEDAAMVVDKAGGYFARPERIHDLDHQGTYFSVRGPLNIARPPQGWPVLVQAGSSPAGMELAAQYAEIIFAAITTGDPTLENAQAYYSRLTDLVREHGRDPEMVKVMPPLMPIIGDTEAEAEAIAYDLSEFADFEYLRQYMQSWLVAPAGRSDLTIEDLDLDQPIPAEWLVDPSSVQGLQSRYESFSNFVRAGKTLRDCLRIFASGRGQLVVVGTVQQVADVMETWFAESACDGFQLTPSHYWSGFDAITDHLIPELQARGLFRTEYPGTTLRDTYGLRRPPGRPTTAVPIASPSAAQPVALRESS